MRPRDLSEPNSPPRRRAPIKKGARRLCARTRRRASSSAPTRARCTARSCGCSTSSRVRDFDVRDQHRQGMMWLRRDSPTTAYSNSEALHLLLGWCRASLPGPLLTSITWMFSSPRPSGRSHWNQVRSRKFTNPLIPFDADRSRDLSATPAAPPPTFDPAPPPHPRRRFRSFLRSARRRGRRRPRPRPRYRWRRFWARCSRPGGSHLPSGLRTPSASTSRTMLSLCER